MNYSKNCGRALRIWIILLSVGGSFLSGAWLLRHMWLPVNAYIDISFDKLETPFFIEGTQLVVENLVDYQGLYLEEIDGEYVSDICGLLLKNGGDRMIRQADVVLQTDAGELCFQATWIPAGEIVLALERDRAFYDHQKIYSCNASCTLSEKHTGALQVGIFQKGMKTLLVQNQSTRILENCRLYYKNLEPVSGVLVGGITYEIMVPIMEPGEVIELSPEFYERGNSRILGVFKES